MKVLFAVWEVDPLIKVGGLGDVARSLPGVLKQKGVDIRIILPFYNNLALKKLKWSHAADIYIKYAQKREKVEIFQLKHPISQVTVYLLKNRYMDKSDFPDTFAFFNKTIISAIEQNILDWQPDIIHCNDLHCGLIPVLTKLKNITCKTLLTIHNLAYQGKCKRNILKKLNIEDEFDKLTVKEKPIGTGHVRRGAGRHSKEINFLREGIIHSDYVNTVSPSYARQIVNNEFKEGLSIYLRAKKDKFTGILNGVDIHWKENKQIQSVNLRNWQTVKKQNKRYLQKDLGLAVNETLPLLSYIGRFDAYQKGIDILYQMLEKTKLNNFEFIILGKGNKLWEDKFSDLANKYPRYCFTRFAFDDDLAHAIYASSDFIIIPSKYEPCGLVQMIAMGFATLPIAHKTGGLADTIKNNRNGFLFTDYSAPALQKSVENALYIWENNRKKYEQMVARALKSNFSWDKSAGEYLDVYRKLVDNSN